MARVSHRMGRLGVDWIDESGKRRWRSFKSEADALTFLGEVIQRSSRLAKNAPGITVGEYAPRWLAVAAVRVKPTSYVRYRRVIVRQILPHLGLEPIATLTAADVRDWVARIMDGERPLSRASAAQALEVLSQVLQQALEDGAAFHNAAHGMAKKLRLTSNAIGRNVQALTPSQLATFLRVAREQDEMWYPAYHLMAVTGIRLGEAFGLRWEDVDYATKTIRVQRQMREDGSVSDPKTHAGRRTVDVSDGTLGLVRELHAQRMEEAAREDQPPGPWILLPYIDEPTREEVVQARNSIRYTMRTLLKRAGLPAHFTPHSFRHTFATIHLSRGESPKWVKEQLGHRTVAITVDLYGSWMRTTSKSAAAQFEALLQKA